MARKANAQNDDGRRICHRRKLQRQTRPPFFFRRLCSKSSSTPPSPSSSSVSFVNSGPSCLSRRRRRRGRRGGDGSSAANLFHRPLAEEGEKGAPPSVAAETRTLFTSVATSTTRSKSSSSWVDEGENDSFRQSRKRDHRVSSDRRRSRGSIEGRGLLTTTRYHQLRRHRRHPLTGERSSSSSSHVFNLICILETVFLLLPLAIGTAEGRPASFYAVLNSSPSNSNSHNVAASTHNLNNHAFFHNSNNDNNDNYKLSWRIQEPPANAIETVPVIPVVPFRPSWSPNTYSSYPSRGGNGLSGAATLNRAKTYLEKYGYLPEDTLGTLTRLDSVQGRENFARALKEFQRRAGLTQSGTLDEATRAMMRRPRCGLKDVVSSVWGDSLVISSEYRLQGSEWQKKDLTWNVVRYTPDLPRETIDRVMSDSFAMWAQYTPLRFIRCTSCSEPDLKVVFAARAHGDNEPFDGPSGILAHAFFPGYGGDIHFDEDETWTHQTYTGVNLMQVAVHEIGHSLGLQHSEVDDAIMAPYYRGYEPTFNLHADDIKGIQQIYGNPTLRPPVATTRRPMITTQSTTRRTPPTTRRTPSTRRPTTTTRTTTRRWYPVTTPRRITTAPTYSTRRSTFSTNAFTTRYSGGGGGGGGGSCGTPPDVCRNPKMDEIVRIKIPRSWDVEYLFKGQWVWKFRTIYNQKVLEPQFPKCIPSVFTDAPNSIDAAFEKDGKLHILKDYQVWKYDSQTLRLVFGYPQSTYNEFGLYSTVDAAFYTGKTIYFLKQFNASHTQMWKFGETRRDHTFIPRVVHAAVEVIQPWEREASGVWLFGPYRADYYRLGDTSNPWSRGGLQPWNSRLIGRYWFSCTGIFYPRGRNPFDKERPLPDEKEYPGTAPDFPEYPDYHINPEDIPDYPDKPPKPGEKPSFVPKEKPDKDSRRKPLPIPGLSDKHPLANQGGFPSRMEMTSTNFGRRIPQSTNENIGRSVGNSERTAPLPMINDNDGGASLYPANGVVFPGAENTFSGRGNNFPPRNGNAFPPNGSRRPGPSGIPIGYPARAG